MNARQGFSAVDSQRPVELWVGAECTVNRVGDVYFDQLQRTGHDVRLGDIDRLAQLGVSRVRFPVLWERTAAGGVAPGTGFAWSDTRLERLADLGIAPIVGLVHHGSGPRGTHLCDSRFVEGLGAFADEVARRYPWVDAYTPVNEPLTTARFSALYGLWYPHATDLGALYRALVNEVLATRASMRAIRRVNAGAELYVTEDIAEIFSTPELHEQCRYENQRRWLSLDLLFGRLEVGHPLRNELEAHGVTARCLDDLCDEPCAPDVVGINYYATSDRFLDSRLERYPPHTHGGNGRQKYADVEAARARPQGIVGHQAVIERVWERYSTPCALTEVHLAGHREDQLRWLHDAWRGVHAARAGGAEVRALTVWSAFGAAGWNTLVTSAAGEYESGVYDIRAPEPRPTALVALASGLARGDTSCPLPAQGRGWWRSSSRLSYSTASLPPENETRPSLVVVGAGAFARRVAEVCARRFDCIATPTLAHAHHELSLTRQKPWSIILAFDPMGVAPALDGDFDEHWPSILARSARELRVLTVSSERVYDGWAEHPFKESDPARPVDEQGESWLALESTIARVSKQAFIVRSGFFMDPERADDPLMRILQTLRRGRVVRVFEDEVVSPTWITQFVDAALDLLIDGTCGVWHLAPRATCSKLDLIRRFATGMGVPFTADVSRRPRRTARGPMHGLTSERGWPLPDLEAIVTVALDHYRQSRATRESASAALESSCARATGLRVDAGAVRAAPR